jgi:hypothetical protein
MELETEKVPRYGSGHKERHGEIFPFIKDRSRRVSEAAVELTCTCTRTRTFTWTNGLLPRR